MRGRTVLALTGLALVACTAFVDPRPEMVSLAVTPVFGSDAAFADDADRLKVTIAREDSTDVFKTVAELFVNIDPATGEADTAIAVPMFQSPTRFRVRLEAVRSSDGVVLFSGESIVSVTAGSSGTGAPIEIPVTYTGPTAARLVLTPSDTAVEAGSTFTFRASTFTAAGGSVNVPVRYSLVNAADSGLLRVDRLTGQATVAAGAEGEALVYAVTPDGLAADTSRVLIGAVPVAVVASPGYANAQPGDAVPLNGAVVDALGNPLTVFPVQWTSRSTAVATVNASGVVTAVAPGSAVIYVNAPDFSGNPAFADSVLVTVVPPGNVVVSSVPDARGFRTVAVGDTVVVEVPADMRFTPSELLGSYNATLSWNPAVMRFVDLQQGDFPLPEVNAANTASGELRFAQANANGTGGVFTLARVRFVAQSAGVTQPALAITEMSAARTFTNLIDRVTVTNGAVIVR